MEDLVGNIQLDPIVSPVGLVVVLLGIRLAMSAVKTVIKLAFLGLILFGAYIFFYGGQISG
ncbi:hypothetical protein BH23ACT9_BH23ACT9_21470 [soil metagenome]